jgi:glycosyltransferase involved in cell wall biosynthesis
MSSETSRTKPRARALLLAYCCSPYHGSEDGAGWNRALGAARYCDTWVICEEKKFAPSIRRYLSEHGPLPGLEFVFVPERFWAPLLWRIPGAGYLSFNWWHRRALRVAERLHAQHRFDLVHQVNGIGFREPGYLWKLDAPFIWGPVGGTQNYPWRFLLQAGVRVAVSEGVRNICNWLQLRLSWRVRRAARKSVAVLTANSTGQRDFHRAYGIRPLLMLDAGIRAVSADVPPTPDPDQPLRILWAGGLWPRKALQLLLHALARLPHHVGYELRILGDGSLRKKWQRLATVLKVEHNCRWIGWVPFEEIAKQYRSADVFIFTSLRDTSGNVMLEALAAGVPVVCLDHQGAHDIVTPECGIKIPVQNPRQVVDDLARAIVRLAQAPAERRRLSRGALERAREYLWSQQAEHMAALYEEVLVAARDHRVVSEGITTPVSEETIL